MVSTVVMKFTDEAGRPASRDAAGFVVVVPPALLQPAAEGLTAPLLDNTSNILETVFTASGTGTRTVGMRFGNIESTDGDSDDATVLFAQLFLTPNSSRNGALDVKIWTGLSMEIEQVAGWLLAFALIPPAVAILLFVFRERVSAWARSLRLLTPDRSFTPPR